GPRRAPASRRRGEGAERASPAQRGALVAPVCRRNSGSLAGSGSDLLDALAPQRRRLSRRARARDPAARLARTADHFAAARGSRSEEHTSELQSRFDLVCRLLLEKKKKWT